MAPGATAPAVAVGLACVSAIGEGADPLVVFEDEQPAVRAAIIETAISKFSFFTVIIVQIRLDLLKRVDG